MTKTKKQLRAEAVERLKNTAHWLMCFYSDGKSVYWHSDYQPERESVGQAMLKDIELLTDDDSTTESLSDEADSREQLEADMREYFSHWMGGTSRTQAAIIGWLDRQAAITAREVKKRVDFSLITQTANAMFPDYQEQVDELQAKVDGLTAERDEYREKLSRAFDLAHEIGRLQP